jgi:hypothetical protein
MWLEVFYLKYPMATVPCKRIIYGKILNESAVGGLGEQGSETCF